MKRIDARIEKCKADLETLYIRARGGEACMGKVIELSKKLDRLIEQRSSDQPR